MSTTVIPTTSSVDALDIDAPAAAQLAKDTAPHGHVVREDGATLIRFDSRDDFRTACENRVIEIENPFLIDVLGASVIVPVLFGWGGQWRWRATATYPAQHACDCGAEVVHQLGCASTEYPDASMFADIPVLVFDVTPTGTPAEVLAHLADHFGREANHDEALRLAADHRTVAIADVTDMPVVVVDVPRDEPACAAPHFYTPCDGPARFEVVTKNPSGEIVGQHPACFHHGFAEVERMRAADPSLAIELVAIDVPRTGVELVHELLPYEGDGELTCNRPYTGAEAVTTTADYVTCPDCLQWVRTGKTPPLAVRAREHAERRTGLPRRIPGATTDVHFAPSGGRGESACGRSGAYSTLATTVPHNVTCPDCVVLVPVPNALRAAYSDERAAAVAGLLEEVSGE